MILSLILLVAGLLALYFGAEALVRGAVSLGLRLGISPLIASLTIVALGTSAPELVVSVIAALHGHAGIALGNIVGSNIFNLGLILGLTAVLVPLRVESQLVKLDIPIMIGVTALFLVFFRDHAIGRGEAVVFAGLTIAYLWLNVVNARAGRATELTREFQEEIKPPRGSAIRDIVLLAVGLGLLVLGSRWFVEGASGIARFYGVSESVIGLTVVAAGTSLPELAASLAAAVRKHADVAVGNIVGSCIFNLLAIGGVAGIVANPLASEGITAIDLALMAALTLLLLPFSMTRFTLSRLEGLALLLLFLGYQFYLWPS